MRKAASLGYVLGSMCLAGVLTACSPVPAESPDQSSVEFHGYQVQMAPGELAAAADLVVTGSVVDEHVVRFADDPLVPAASMNEPGVDGSSYTKASVAIRDVLAGEAPQDTIAVARMETLVLDDGTVGAVSGDEDVRLEVGRDYVLFLSLGDGIWTGKYLALGAQGVGVLENGTATFRDGRTITLTALRRAIETSDAPS